MKELLLEFMQLLFEKKVREAQLSGGKKAAWGSDEHVIDLEGRWMDMCAWRDRHPKGSEARANYARIAHRLKNELKSAKKQADKRLQEKQRKQNED